ncbi:MAG: zf-HC2 domain-containing protein [Lachnospiraceae bacterium]|nr:zf-HC2 domain-containing protein [Lachnospiraceae bacterium]
MTCLEAQSNILSFVEEQLPEDKKVEFVRHMKHCSNCKEELEIYYTLIVGMRKLDNNEEFSLDFKNRLDEELTRIDNRAKKAKRFKVSSFSIVFSIMVVVMFFFYSRCLLKVYNIEQFMKKQAQGETYFYDTFGEYLNVCRDDIIVREIRQSIPEKLTFYDKIRIYNTVNSFIIEQESE